MAENQNTIIQ